MKKWISAVSLSLSLLLSLSVNAIDSKDTKAPAESKEASTEKGTKDSKNTKGADNKTEGEAKTLQYFDTVNLSGVGNFYIKQSSESSFTVEAEKSVLPLAIVYVKDKTLFIDLKNASEHSDSKINYYLNIKNLKNIISSSSSTIFMQDSFETDELNVSINSFGEASLFVNVKKLKLKIEGGGKATLRGRAAEQDIQISGAGEFNGAKLKGENANVDASGSGLVTTDVSNNLNVKLSGDSAVKYCGKPSITKDIAGKGTVSPADDKDCK